MPKASKETASESVQLEGYEGHFETFEGGFTVAFETYSQDADLTPFYKGLPDDRCQCEHWGYVLDGKVTFKVDGREETFEAGDAYYAPPGHTPVLHAGTEVVEFSPTGELRRTMEVVTKNMEINTAEEER
jgi:mannose-6-phosphate isomerase-like protein (cupin superfamily)